MSLLIQPHIRVGDVFALGRDSFRPLPPCRAKEIAVREKEVAHKEVAMAKDLSAKTARLVTLEEQLKDLQADLDSKQVFLPATVRDTADLCTLVPNSFNSQQISMI